MSPPIKIRRSTAEDEKMVIALWASCNLTVSANDTSKDFQFARGKQNSDILLGVNETGKIISSIMVGHDGHRGWIYYVAVNPAFRHQGIGRQMITAAEEWLKERKVAKIMLMIRDTNTQVIDFYKRLGFDTEPRVIMSKRF